MKNYGILKFGNVGIEDFTSNTGLRIRKVINPFLRKILRLVTKGEIIIDHYPRLKPNTAYIFTSTHNFVEDAIANLATIDRNAYLLFGTSDQLQVNKEMYFAWLNGFIYVNRENEKSRREAIHKMERVLKAGNSVLIYPEGGFNNTENLLCQKLFFSPYILSKLCGVQVVPIAPYNEFGKDIIYMNVGNPIDLSVFEDKNEAMIYLRDILATLLYEELCMHAPKVKRIDLGLNPRLDYMEERRQEYMKTKWTKDVWEEELTRYYDKKDREYIAVQDSMDNIVIDKNNAVIMAPIVRRRIEDKKYDFKLYMHKNWENIVV